MEYVYEQLPVETDERFMGDWIAFGFAEMETYLLKHARFDAYCARRGPYTGPTSDPGSEED